MIGNNPDADIRGAVSFGMRAIWKRDDYWDPPDATDGVIQDLEELPGAIDDLG